MAKFGKWIGGALGWAVGGPIGAVLGFAFGSMFDDTSLSQEHFEGRTIDDRYKRYRHNTRPGDFASSLIVLSAVMMKADGRVLKSELNYVRAFLERQFGKDLAQQHLQLLKRALDQDIDVKAVCNQIRYFMEHSNRLFLLQYLFGIAGADGSVDQKEKDELRRIAGYLGISSRDLDAIMGMHSKSSDSYYKVLEIDKSATDAEVKKAYRAMANKFHPDKVSNLGEKYQEQAEERFFKVQEAYEAIKKERGFK